MAKLLLIIWMREGIKRYLGKVYIPSISLGRMETIGRLSRTTLCIAS